MAKYSRVEVVDVITYEELKRRFEVGELPFDDDTKRGSWVNQSGVFVVKGQNVYLVTDKSLLVSSDNWKTISVKNKEDFLKEFSPI